MTPDRAESPAAPREISWLALAALLLTPVLVLLTALPAGPVLLPLLAPLTVYPAFCQAVRQRRYGLAWGLGMAWGGLLSLGVILLVAQVPDLAARGILHGEAYRQEMFHWVATGGGREGDWTAFLPQHVLHLGVFLLLTWASAGYLGLALGALLVAYMSYFVGSYAGAASSLVAGALVAWVPWSVVRVGAFVLLGSIFARPLLVRQAWPFSALERRLMLLGVAGILADLLLKAWLAETYGLFLRRFAGGALP